MLNANQIKENLINDNKILLEILNENFTNIKEYEEEIRMSFSEESSANGTVVYRSNLYCRYFSENIQGDLYVLLQRKRNATFKEVHRYLNSFFGEEYENTDVVRKHLFGGFFIPFIGNQNEITDRIYNDEELKQYSKRPNLRFLDDGISIKTQLKFGIGYDFQSHYITIPWINSSGDTVGVKGRRNSDDDDKPKYLALKKFKKTNYLYGYFQNRNEILRTRKIILAEAEKSVLQADSFGIHNVVAIGSHDVSEQQILLMKYDVKQITLMLDEDVDEEEVFKQCRKIKNKLKDVKVFYCIDRKNIMNDKESPFDNGREVFFELCKQIKEFRGDDDE